MISARGPDSASADLASADLASADLALMSGHPCLASLTLFPDRSPVSASFGGGGQPFRRSRVQSFSLGIAPFRGMAKPTIPQVRDQAEVLWGRYSPE